MKLKERDVVVWIAKNGLRKDIKILIMQNVKNKLEENKDVDVENLLSILTCEDRKSIKRLMCLPMLRRIPMFNDMSQQVLEMICDNLKPVIYHESCYMFREGDPLDRMLFITQGTAWAFKNSSSTSPSIHSRDRIGPSCEITTRRLKRHDYLGEELLLWSLTHNTTGFPISTKNLKSQTKVEAFALMANDLMSVVGFGGFSGRISLPARPTLDHDRWETLALSAVRAFRNSIKKKTKMKHSKERIFPAPHFAAD